MSKHVINLFDFPDIESFINILGKIMTGDTFSLDNEEYQKQFPNIPPELGFMLYVDKLEKKYSSIRGVSYSEKEISKNNKKLFNKLNKDKLPKILFTSDAELLEKNLLEKYLETVLSFYHEPYKVSGNNNMFDILLMFSYFMVVTRPARLGVKDNNFHEFVNSLVKKCGSQGYHIDDVHIILSSLVYNFIILFRNDLLDKLDIDVWEDIPA